MRIASSQPTFLSYPGYFGLIDFVDKFVVMDNIQFASRSWQQRVLIQINKETKFLTLPVLKKKKQKQLIHDAIIDNSTNYIKKHLMTIKHSYSKTKFFDKYYPEIELIYNKKYNKLIDLNLTFIFFFLKNLKINDNKIIKLSDLEINKNVKKDKLIYEICAALKANEYISTIGAKKYLEENKKLNDSFQIQYFDYHQNKRDLTDYNKKKYHLSIIDLLFNYGDKTKEIIRSQFCIIDNF